MRPTLPGIIDKLACPACRSGLTAARGELICTRAACRFHSAPFPLAGTQPVLVDFEHSILNREAVIKSGATTVVTRNTNPLGRLVRAVLFGTNEVAPANERQLIELARQLAPRPTILVVGGGTVGSGAGAMYERPDVDVVAFDIYASSHTDYVADAHRIPMRDESVDAVWIQAVLEHVLTPAAVVDEIRRVLRPNGIVYAETPFMQHVHEAAYDFQRYTHSGHRWLFRHFEEINSGVVAGAGTQLLWSIDHFFRATLHSQAAGRMAKLFFWPLRFVDAIGDKAATIDAASCLFFLGRKSDAALDPADMPAYYRASRHGIDGSKNGPVVPT